MKHIVRRLTMIVAIVAIVAIAVAAYIATITPRIPANAIPVRRGDISAAATATGKVQSKKSARLSLPASGIVATVSKMEGDDVNSGDVILALKADDANRRVQQAQLAVDNRQLDLTRAKAAPRDEDIDIARANLAKATAAAAAADATYTATPTAQNDAARQISHADLDIARANFNRTVNGPTQEELDALQNAVTGAQLDLDTAKAALGQTRLTAPFTSTVTEVDVHEGELAGSFSTLAVVADLNSLVIAADIDEIDVANAQVGQPVQVRLDAFPGERFDGKLMRLFPAASTQRGTTTYSAVVDFDRHGVNVRPGMGATMQIQTTQKTGVLLVPNATLKSIGSRKAVRVVAPGQPHDQIVETGVTDGTDTEIISGVNENDLVLPQ
jgi:HlyD family secretion protein